MGRIDCEAHSKSHRYFYVDEYMRVWPCCYFSYAYKPGLPDPEVTDPLYNEKLKDPDWNKLTKRSYNDIINDPLFKDYTFYPGWESNPSPICVFNCCK